MSRQSRYSAGNRQGDQLVVTLALGSYPNPTPTKMQKKSSQEGFIGPDQNAFARKYNGFVYASWRGDLPYATYAGQNETSQFYASTF